MEATYPLFIKKKEEKEGRNIVQTSKISHRKRKCKINIFLDEY
ncbi:unnamed protein product [Spirodela intermedia]|uniref:Uncharacterized protein n=1 Tax=Spirodela intermedia TaxID=51605 RepID=A0ABN7EB15_SPIIN|nr:unnamed protein product [Spirodela intermedia]